MSSTRSSHSNVVDLAERRGVAATDRYCEAADLIVTAEAALFAEGKFTPFARSYIASGFDPDLRPAIELTVRFRDDRLLRPARLLLAALRGDGFAYSPGLRWAKGKRPKANASQDAWGPELTRQIDIREARSLFTERLASPFGAYQASALGFRTAHVRIWDARGIGFSIIAGGHDDRRGDPYGGATRPEHHIVDSNEDLGDLIHMAALVARARLTVS